MEDDNNLTIAQEYILSFGLETIGFNPQQNDRTNQKKSWNVSPPLLALGLKRAVLCLQCSKKFPVLPQ